MDECLVITTSAVDSLLLFLFLVAGPVGLLLFTMNIFI